MKGRVLSTVLVLVLAATPTMSVAGASQAMQFSDQVLAVPSLAELNSGSGESFKGSPVMFIENRGQWDDAALFQVWGGHAGSMWLAEDAIWLTLLEPNRADANNPAANERELALGFWSGNHDATPRRGVNIKLSFPGANPHPTIESFSRLDTKISYFHGNKPEQWWPDVPVWGGVRYKELYPGIDLEFTHEDGRLVQRLVAQAGADRTAVRLRVAGADTVVQDGYCLRLNTALGQLTFPLFVGEGWPSLRLQVQPNEGQACDLYTSFQPADSHHQPKIEDPRSPADNSDDLLYSIFLGGNANDHGYGIAVDVTDNVYVTGTTNSGDFPTTPGAFDTSYNGSLDYDDVFVATLNPAGRALVYATFLGGSGYESGRSITVDRTGSAYVMGWTESRDFPTTPGTFDTSFNGWCDLFVVKLNPAGSSLTYATLLGGSGGDWGYVGSGIAVDRAGNAYVSGSTTSWDFPTTPGAFDRYYSNYQDGFVAKLNPAGSALDYATFLGGSDYDTGHGIAVDGAGSAYVTGGTFSTNFPFTAGAFDTSYNGGGDTYVAKLNPTGSELVFATFLGGSDGDVGVDVALHGVGSAYVTGMTSSSDFPATPGAFDTSYDYGDCGNVACSDTFVVKLNPAGSALSYATFLGADDDDISTGIAVDGVGRVYVTGSTSSSDFPTTPDAWDTSLNGTDAFVVQLAPSGQTLTYATFLGGNDYDGGFGVAVNRTGSAYVTGGTGSSDFPVTPGAFGTGFNGGSMDVFVAKLTMGPELRSLYLPIILAR